MKILRITQEFYPAISGPAKQAYNISSLMMDKGHDSPILTTNAGTTLEPGFDAVGRVPVRRIAVRGRIMRCYYTPSLKQDLCLHGVDVVHVHGWRNYMSDYSIYRARRAGIPVVLHAHGTIAMFRHLNSRLHRWPYLLYDAACQRAIVRSASMLVVSTNQEKEEAERYGFHPERIAVIPSGIDPGFLSHVDHQQLSGTGPLRLLLVGRLSADRNVEQVIEAVAHLAQLGRRVELRIVGPEVRRSSLDSGGYLSRLIRLAKSLGVEREVVFVGQQQGEDLKAEYRRADVFVYTSRYENFGNTVLEAAAYGLPLVTTSTGIGPDLVRLLECGAVVSLGNPCETAEAVIALAESDALNPYSKRSRALRVAERFTWSRIGQQYEDIYRQMTEDRGFSIGVEV